MHELFADREFLKLKYELLQIGIVINASSADEHQAEAEREIKFVKQRVRCIWYSVPFK